MELEQLQKALTLLNIKDYIVLDKENESPDFIVKIGCKNVGIEVTEVYREFAEGNSAKTESDLPTIVEEAIQLYNENGGIPYAFVFAFNGEESVVRRKDFIKELSEFLYKYVANNLANGNRDIIEISPDVNQFPLLAILNRIHAQKINNAVAVGSTVSGYGTVNIHKNIITSVISSKEKKLNEYRERCKTIWLLIVLPSMTLSSDFSLSDERIYVESTGFDAMYVLDHYRDKIQCINQA